MDLSSRQAWLDRALPWLLGAGVAALAWFTGNSLELPPELWDEVAVAASLRPPAHEFPIVWQNILSIVISNFGIDAGIRCLKLAGPVSLGLLAVMAFRLFAGCLPGVMKKDARRTSWGRWIVRSLVIQGALLFVLSDPVWRAGRVLSPEMLSLLATLLIFLLGMYAMEKSKASYAYLTGALSGFAASEIPLAFLVPAALSLCLFRRSLDPDRQDEQPLNNPAVLTVVLRRMAWIFVLCWIAASVVNLASFRLNGGVGAADAGAFVGVVNYLLNYIAASVKVANAFGWMLMAAVVLIPLLIVAARVRALMDVKKFMPVAYGCFLAVVCTLAFLQSSGFRDFHFWRWSYGSIRSQYLLCLCLFATSLTAMLTLGAFATDIYFRNHGKLLRTMFPEEMEVCNPIVWRVLRSFRPSIGLLRPVMRFEPLVVLALAVPFKFDQTVHEMTSIVNGIVRQTADECGDSTMLFTDGSFDAAVEVAAKKDGRRLKAMSMMSGAGRYDTALRTRGVESEEDQTLLSIGAADALRTWVMTENPCVSNIALQVGLELWRKNNLPMPRAGGLVSRTAGFPSGMSESYAESARSMAERILRLYADGKPMESGYPELNSLFLFGQWRLSRMCRMRANEADGRHDVKTSEMENALADQLDRFNPEWQKIQEKMDWIGKQDGMRLTPREGLRLGLERADFRLARSYARKVVLSDADDVHANFALGMGYFTEKQYGRAEMHLKKCLVRAPREPAVLNNLAIVQLRLGRFAEAETNALQALTHFPDSSEIKTTLQHIRAAREGRPVEPSQLRCR